MNKINFPVVGIGASAGGLKVLQEFSGSLPDDPGIAFVVIIHLAPQKTSALDELLSHHTSMSVQQVKSNTPIEPNHVYVISPSKRLRLQGKNCWLRRKKRILRPLLMPFFVR